MKVTNKYIGALLLGLGLAGMQGCSDTWDEHYLPTADSDVSTSNQTLWDIISNDPQLSKFAEVVRKARYYRDEQHPQYYRDEMNLLRGYTYQNMLESTQLVTVWAPTNDAFTDAEWQQWNEYTTDERAYTVHQQLMSNSIALWRNIANGGGVDTLAMLNGKKVSFDKENGTMAGLDIAEKNIAASNGTLHKMETPLPFIHNLYEYLKDKQNTEVSHFRDYIVDNDTIYFNRDASIEGVRDPNGTPTYVDSAYVTSNALFFGTHNFPSVNNREQYDTFDEGFGANIAGEDSCFLMVVPTDVAWEDGWNKIEKYYNYAHKYIDKKKQDEKGLADNDTVLDYRYFATPDSLKQKCLTMDLTSPLCFNVNLQPNAEKRLGQWTAETLLDRMTEAPYLRNTFGDTLRTDDTWQKESLFQGRREKKSNGYAIFSDTWNVPRKIYKPDVIVELNYHSIFNKDQANGTPYTKGFSNEVAKAWIDTVGVVSFNDFLQLTPKTKSTPVVFDFKLVGSSSNMENAEAEVMSGKYDIYLVVVPNFYLTSTDTIDTDRDLHKKHRIKTSITYRKNDEDDQDATEYFDIIEYTDTKVDTLLLKEDFEFPYSYKNLRYCYPTFTITTTDEGLRSNEKQKYTTNYNHEICIDRIILRSKED